MTRNLGLVNQDCPLAFSILMWIILFAMAATTLTLGLSENFGTPCGHLAYDSSSAKTLLDGIPILKQLMNDKVNLVSLGRFSGLAPLHDDGPLDDCHRLGVWQPSLQQLLPCVTDETGSGGAVGMW